MPHPDALRAAERYASLAAERFGDRLVGVYLFGSGALGGFDSRRSDVDLLVVLEGRADTDCRDIRRVQVASGLRSAARALRQGIFTGAGTCNAAYVSRDQLDRPVTAIDPIGSHVGHQLVRGQAFDVNPVQWRTLLEHGVTVVGAPLVELELDPEPEKLVRWNHQNLHDYWLPLARRVQGGHKPLRLHSLGAGLHWSVLGPLRLHATIATGDVLSKRAAGDHGLAIMDQRWHSLIRAAQLALDGHSARRWFPSKRDLLRQIGDFGIAVVDSADARLGGPPTPVT